MKSLKTVVAGCVLIFLGAAHAPHPRMLSVSFEKNQGQAPSDVRFLARGSGFTMAFTPQGNRIDLSRSGKRVSFTTSFAEANPSPAVRGEEKQSAKVNYFRGRQSLTNIPTFARVRYENVYRGIDLTYYGTQRELEYDFSVKPEADPAAIALHFEGTDRLTIDSRGDLLVQ